MLTRRLARGAALLRGLAWVGGLLAGLAASAAIQDPAAAVRIEKLSNGLTVLLLPDASTPVVSLQIWVRVGSRDETRWTGIAHLFEHMMFRGTERLAPEQHERLIEARGGRVNAFTTRDVTVYFEDFAPETLPLALALEAERLAHLRITRETLASERQVVLEERRLRTEDNPEGRLFETLMGLAFLAHPYRRPVIGWKSDVEQVPVEACRAFFRTYYAPNNLVLALVGPIDPDAALAAIRRRFGGLRPAETIPRNPTREPPQLGERRATLELDVKAPRLAVAWHAPPAGAPDAEALDVLGQILAGGRSSRLYRRLVYREEKALGIDAGYWELQDAGLFTAEASVRPGGSPAEVEQLLFEEIARVRSRPVSEQELAKAKRQLEVGLVAGLATSHALASRIARDYVIFGRIRPLEERLERIRAVQASDVQRVAKQYLDERRRTVVWLLPKRGSSESPAGARAKR